MVVLGGGCFLIPLQRCWGRSGEDLITRESERECVCESESVCVCERERVCERDREGEGVSEI